MSTLGNAFTSALHANHLKPCGFKKTRHTFSRSHDGFTEHYQVQGSAWNDRNGPWTFYLNCGISFDGLPLRDRRDFPRTHAWMRASLFVAAALSQYDITQDNLTSTAAHLADVICQCSEYFQRRYLVLRDCYEHQCYHMGFLDDPELRNAIE